MMEDAMLLTLNQMLKCSDIERYHLTNMRERNQIALAFGRHVAADSLDYLPVDCLVLTVSNTLAQSYSRKLSAQFCLVHFDILAGVLAVAESNPKKPAYFSVIDYRVRGQRAHIACGTSTDDPELIAFELARTPLTARAHADRITSVNVSMLRADIIKNATKHGLDLSAPWLPPLHSPELAELLQPYVERRDNAIANAVAAGAKARKLLDAMIPTGVAN
jgi:hypothetical protein